VTRRERRAFARLVEIVCAPQPPLPPVAQTDAVDAFERWMARAPTLNRVLARGVLLLLGERVVGLEPMRAAAAMSYYGDPRVAEVVGHAPRAR
jgi:hypothetical protein